MSGVVGVLNLDGAPVHPDLLDSMMQSIAYRGPDGRAIHLKNNLGLGHTLLVTTPQEHRSSRPYSLNDRYHIVADACLYNREELVSQLSVHSLQTLKEAPDCVLILKAYEKWGAECTSHLVGDFSFAIWDAKSHRLFIARDPMGVRQLYYAQQNEQLLFSTDVSAILCALPEQPPLNRLLLEEMLLDNNQRWTRETVYQKIFKLEPGCQLTAHNKHINISRFYELTHISPVVYKSDHEYVEHFREVFTKAVDSRLRSSTPTGLVVSGGVDSSTITAICKQLHQQNDADRQTPILYSYAGENSQQCDDWYYLQKLINSCGNWRSSLIDGDQLWALKKTLAESNYRPDEPEIDLTTHGWIDIAHRANQDGTRVLLTGHGGDQIMLGDAYHSPQLLGRLAPAAIVSEWKYFKDETSYSSLRLFKTGLLRPLAIRLLPAGAKRYLRTRMLQNSKPDWVNGEIHQHADYNNQKLFRHSNAIQRHGIHMAVDATQQRGNSVFDQASGLHHVEHRYPYFDTRVIELVLGLPTRMFFRNGQTKWILRQLTKGLLPESLRNRRTYCTNQDWIDEGWRSKEKHIIEACIVDSRTAGIGLVDQTGLGNAWANFWAGDNSDLWHLSAWLNIELWMRNRQMHTKTHLIS